MTARNKKPPRAADWVAVRRVYEAGSDPLHVIAFRHGVKLRTLQHRRKKEGWFRARLRGDGVDWLEVRRDYESGERSICEICERHGCSRYGLHQRRLEENWQPRRPAYPSAFGAGGKVNAAVRLNVLLVKRLEALERHLQPDETGMLTLARALEKVTDIEAKEKRRDAGESSGRLIINDDTRMALARRLEALAESWEADKEQSAGETEGRDLGPLPPHA